MRTHLRTRFECVPLLDSNRGLKRRFFYRFPFFSFELLCVLKCGHLQLAATRARVFGAEFK